MTSAEFLTFDCYGTLIDWKHGLVEACRAAAAADGVELTPATVLAIHAAVEPELQAGAYRSYREVLTDVALAIARRAGWELSRERARFLPDSLPAWLPFPDTNPALATLARSGLRLGILSNVDDDLLAGTLTHFPVRFDLLVTAERVRAYKPAHQHFERARETIGDRRWVHVAQSYFHDVQPAHALGVPVIWVNRAHEAASGSAVPLAEVDDLGGVVEWFERR